MQQYRIRIYDHIKKEIIKHVVVEASSISLAAKLAEMHHKELEWEHCEKTIKIDELKDDN